MGFTLAILGFALGCLMVLLSNPVQVVPRFMHSIKHVSVARIYRRWRVEYPFKRPFFTLSFLAALLLLGWFFVAMMAPVENDYLLVRLLLGVGVGGFVGWTLFCRREILLGSVGIVGLYPNPRLVVPYGRLAGYFLMEEPQAVVLVAKSGEPLEALPVRDDVERRDLELALLPHIPRLHDDDIVQRPLAATARRSLLKGHVLLLASFLPLLSFLLSRLLWQRSVPSVYLAISIVAAIVVPLGVFDWSQRFRMLYYSSKGHVYVAQLIALCHRCYYQSVCWQSGLQRRIRWQRGVGAIVPTWEEFSQGFRHELKITPEIYESCCQCLVDHMQEQDLYRINLIPLYPSQPAGNDDTDGSDTDKNE